MTLNVGDTLWYVDYNSGRNKTEQEIGLSVTVGKVARKWVTVSVYGRLFRINKDTLEADGGQYSSPGRCYASQEAFLAERRLNRLWFEFSRRVSPACMPPGITEEQIRAVALMFDVPLKDQ